MKYIYNKIGELISTKFAGTDEEFKQEFGDDIFIRYENLGEKAIIEGDTIRAMTRLDKVLAGEESLSDGEYIEDNEIKYIPKSSNFDFWDSGKNVWVYDAELEKSFIEEEIGNLEGQLSNLYDELDKAISRKLKMREKQLNEQIDKLSIEIENKYNRLAELEG